MDGMKCETPQERGARMMRESGYATGGTVTMTKVKREVKRGVREHETQEHGGKHSHLKLASGGSVHGEHAGKRPDRKGGKGTVNIIIATGGGQEAKQQAAQQGLQAGVQIGARAAAQKLAGAGGMPPGGPPMGARPPMPMGPPPGAGPGGPPPMMAGRPPMPPQMAATGGSVKVRAHQRRKAGGAVG